MAENQTPGKDNSRSESTVEAAKPPSLGGQIASMLGKAWDFVTGDAYLNAMARQGANEMGSALKAFPDSISEYRYVHTQAEEDSPAADRSPWPSELAEANRHLPTKDHSSGLENGKDTGYSM